MKEGKTNVKPGGEKGCTPVCIDIIMNKSDSIILSVYTSTVNVPSGGLPQVVTCFTSYCGQLPFTGFEVMFTYTDIRQIHHTPVLLNFVII